MGYERVGGRGVPRYQGCGRDLSLGASDDIRSLLLKACCRSHSIVRKRREITGKLGDGFAVRRSHLFADGAAGLFRVPNASKF